MWAKGLKRCSNTKFITPFDGGRIEETKIFRTDRHRDDFLDKDKSGSFDYFFKPIVQQREEDKEKARQRDNQKRIDDL